jgi:hypothetical protein
MYQHRPEPTWPARLFGSARTLAAIVLTALLASALTVRWSDAEATGAFGPESGVIPVGIPVTVEGTLVDAGDDLIALVEYGAETPVAFPIGDDAQFLRAGESVSLDALHSGDNVRMTIDGSSGNVLRLHATPAAGSAFQVPGTAAFLAALGLIAGATALAIRNPERLPSLPAHSPRLYPVGATR